jgi:hypothetical protein
MIQAVSKSTLTSVITILLKYIHFLQATATNAFVFIAAGA